ncbi:MAG: hypothetical protein KMY50_02495, partial [Candidatus Desulforudis sp.]|nr:hypothetical protein [Desulforudis sp.]
TVTHSKDPWFIAEPGVFVKIIPAPMVLGFPGRVGRRRNNFNKDPWFSNEPGVFAVCHGSPKKFKRIKAPTPTRPQQDFLGAWRNMHVNAQFG